MAEMVLADIQVKQAKQEFLGVTERREIRFSDFAEEYLAYSKANKAASTFERDCFVIEKHLLPRWGDRILPRISPKDVEAYKLERLELVTAATLNRELFVISNMFRKAVEWGYLREYPLAGVKKIKTGLQRFRYLTRDEIDRLLKSSRESSNPQLYTFLVTALNTGMRLGELTALEWKDIDFGRKTILVDNKEDHHTKNYECRTIPMNDLLAEVLESHPRHSDSPYVFVRGEDGEKFHKMRTSFENAVKRAGIPHVRFHDLRHTFASHLVMGGVDIRTVQELLGHKDIRMTMRYSHLAPDHMKSAVQVLDRRVAEEEGKVPDGHYLDTEVSGTEKQGVGVQP
jgi:integrase